MIDPKALLTTSRAQVGRRPDLRRTGLASDGCRASPEWQAAGDVSGPRPPSRRGCGERVTQVAVAWVLGTVFVRFCEDNDLIEYPFIAGPGDRVALAANARRSSSRDPPERPTGTGSSKASTPCQSPRWPPDCSNGTTRCGRSPVRTTRPRRCWRSGATRRRTPRSVHDFTDEPGTPASSATSTRTCPKKPEDLRPAADARVRRGVHPRLHPRSGDRGVRPGT